MNFYMHTSVTVLLKLHTPFWLVYLFGLGVRLFQLRGFPCSSVGKESACNGGHLGSILRWEDPLEKEMATHYSIFAWKIPMDRGAQWAAVHGVTKQSSVVAAEIL